MLSNATFAWGLFAPQLVEKELAAVVLGTSATSVFSLAVSLAALPAAVSELAYKHKTQLHKPHVD